MLFHRSTSAIQAACLILSVTLPVVALGQSLPQASSTGVAVTGGVPKVYSPTLPRTTAATAATMPALPRTAYTRYPWRTDIVATVFWVGEQPTANNPTPNHKSSWDVKWAENYGGYDDPDPAKRTENYTPKGFTPGLNPFYVALPYNDCVNYKQHKPEAANIIPWFKTSFVKSGRSVLRGTWLAIRHGNRVCYAQWEDCGPFITDDPNYVFGSARPKNTFNKGAGIDLSPAVRDYLGMSSGAKVDWRFVDVGEIPPGPWSRYGMNNHFVRIPSLRDMHQRYLAQNRMEELRRAQDQRFNGGAQ